MGLGYNMVEAATVSLLPIAGLEQQLGITITSIDDIPLPVRSNVLGATLRGTDYAISEVSREFSTEFVHHAGQRIFVLDDGTCQYAMKYYTSIYEADLVDEDAASALGDKFQLLPDGFSFSVVTLDEDLVISETGGTQYVVVDEFGNSYDRFACE